MSIKDMKFEINNLPINKNLHPEGFTGEHLKYLRKK